MGNFFIILYAAMAVFVPFAIYLKIAGEAGWFPADKAELMIMIASFIFLGVVIAALLPLILPSLASFFSNPFLGSGRAAKRIRATGRRANATVLTIGESSQGVVTVNEQPYLHLKLLIEDGKTNPYEVEFDTIIPRTTVPQFQPGAVFPVKIDPKNSQKVILDFSPPETKA
jgi:hypothetical protein